MPTYGRKSAQFVDLLEHLPISTLQVLEKVCAWWGVYGLYTFSVVCGVGYGLYHVLLIEHTVCIYNIIGYEN